MNIVNVATLKERLSHFLGLVKDGEEVIVTSHRHRIARILPISAPTSLLREPTRAIRELRQVKGIRARDSVSAVDALLEDRKSR